jgi:hypothetical protein
MINEINRKTVKAATSGWSKEGKVKIAVYAAELLLPFSKCGIELPLKAIEAAKAWVSEPSEESRVGAYIPSVAIIASKTNCSVAMVAMAASDAAAYNNNNLTDFYTSFAVINAVKVGGKEVENKIINYINKENNW